MAISRHCNCFPSSVAMDGKDRNGFQLEKLGELEVSMLCPQKSPKKIIIVFFPMEFV